MKPLFLDHVNWGHVFADVNCNGSSYLRSHAEASGTGEPPALAVSRSAAHWAAPPIAQPANRATGEPTETLQKRFKIEVKHTMKLWS